MTAGGIMYKAIFAFLLLTPALTWATKPVPNSADYTITVHVQSSQLINNCGTGGCIWTQQLTVLIDGKNYVLLAPGGAPKLLRGGDYKARIAKDDTASTYEYLRDYEFLFADGKVRLYNVVGESE
jgi:hypothetical protein